MPSANASRTATPAPRPRAAPPPAGAAAFRRGYRGSALVVVGALVGTAVGVSGLAGRPVGETTVDVPVSLSDSAPVFACVDGPLVARIPGGTRVLATERSEDSTWVGVRDPLTLGGTLWVGLGDVSLDDGVPALEALPVGGDCPTTVVALPAVEPEPVVTEEPTPGPSRTARHRSRTSVSNTPHRLRLLQTARPSRTCSRRQRRRHQRRPSWTERAAPGSMTKGSAASGRFTLDPSDVDLWRHHVHDASRATPLATSSAPSHDH